MAPIIGKLGRQHATKGRHLAGFSYLGRLFRLDSPNRSSPARTGSGVAPAGDDAIRPVARQGGQTRLLDTLQPGRMRRPTTLPAAWRIRRGWLAGGARPSSVVKSRQSGLFAHSMETPARQCCRAKTFLERDLFPLHRSGVVVPRRPGSLHPGRNACATSQPCRRRGQNLPGTPPARQEIAAKPRQTGNGMELAVWEHGEAFSPRPIDSQSIAGGDAGRHRSSGADDKSPEVQIMKVTPTPQLRLPRVSTQRSTRRKRAPHRTDRPDIEQQVRRPAAPGMRSRSWKSQMGRQLPLFGRIADIRFCHRHRPARGFRTVQGATDQPIASSGDRSHHVMVAGPVVDQRRKSDSARQRHGPGFARHSSQTCNQAHGRSPVAHQTDCCCTGSIPDDDPPAAALPVGCSRRLPTPGAISSVTCLPRLSVWRLIAPSLSYAGFAGPVPCRAGDRRYDCTDRRAPAHRSHADPCRRVPAQVRRQPTVTDRQPV